MQFLLGYRLGKFSYKLSLFADDLFLLLSDPVSSLPALQHILDSFKTISGLYANPSKSVLYPLNLFSKTQVLLHSNHPYQWVKSTWSYLGLNIPLKLDLLLQVNYLDIIKSITSLLHDWHADTLWINTIKSFIFPNLLYYF